MKIVASICPARTHTARCLLVLLTIATLSVTAQVPIPGTYPANGEIYPWGYQPKGTAWNTSQFLPFVYSRMPFRMLLPAGVTYNQATNTFTNSTGEKFPLLVFLHGAGVYGSDNAYQLSIGGKEVYDAYNSGKLRGILVFPQNFTSSWGTTQQSNVLGIISRLIAKGLVDPFAVSLTGTSSGGTAAWALLSSSPSVFASCAPMSAAALTTRTYIPGFVHVPMWLAQGAFDSTPKASTANSLVSSIQAAGANLRYTYYADIGHGTWDYFLLEPDLYPFFSRANKTNPHVFFGQSEFCSSSGINIRLGVTAGFEAYEWRRNGQPISGATTNEIVVTQLGTYDVRIRRNGEWSYWSPIPVIVRIKPATITPAIQLATPSSVVIPDINGNSNVTLQVRSGYTGYAWRKTGSTQVIGTAQQITVNTPGEYTASVTEQYGCSSVPSAGFTVINSNGTGAPYPAIDLVASASSDTEIKLQWNQNPSSARNETGFEIWRRESNSTSFKFISLTNADVTTFTDGGLTPNTKYVYKIRPMNSFGAASATPEAESTTLGDPIPTAPANVRVLSTTANSINIAWNPSTDNQGIQLYEVYGNGNKCLTTSNTSATVYNLTTNQVYTFKLKAKDTDGNYSVFSNQVTAVASITNQVPGPQPLSPINLTAELSGEDVRLNWQDTSAYPLTGFQLWRSTDSTATFVTIGTTPASSSSFLDESVEPASTYYYKVIALATNGQSPFSTMASITTDSLPPVPYAPFDLVSTPLSTNSILLTFSDTTETALEYDLYRSAENNLSYMKIASLPADSTDSLSYIDDQLFVNATYYYKVKARNTGGESEFSNETSAKTFNNPPAINPIEARIMRWATTLNLTVRASDPDDEIPSFSLDSLPSFGQYTDVGNGTVNLSFSPLEADSGEYKIAIHAHDLNGGLATDTLRIIVNNNNNPTILPITIPAVNEGDSRTAAFSVTDADGDSVSVNFINLPSFAAITPTGLGTGIITLTPGYHQSGNYSVTIEAEDEQGGKTYGSFSIIVNNVKNSYRLLINFGRTNLTVAAPWNNTAASPTAGITRQSLLDSDNQSTSVGLTLVTAWVSGSFTGAAEGGAYPGIYPDNAMRSYYYTNTNDYKTIRFNGLNRNFKYNFTFFGSRAATGNYSTEYRIGNTTVSLNPTNNTSNTVKISGVTPSTAGEVDVLVRRASGAQYGFLNVMEVEAYVDEGRPPLVPTNLAATTVSGSSVSLTWQDVAYTETRYDLFRSENGTDYTKIASPAVNATVYTDNTVVGKRTYYYKLQSVNTYGASAFSNVVQVTTPNAIPAFTLPSPTMLAEESITTLSITATDTDDNSVTFTLGAHPAFVAFTPTGPKSGTLTIAPPENSKGSYSISMEATDGNTVITRTGTIVVTDDEITSTYINFNNTANAPLPWNNMAGTPSANFSRTNLRDEKNVATGINVSLINAWTGAGTTGTTTGNNSGIYPDDVMRTSYYESSTATKQLRFTGLSSTNLYNFIFFGSRSGTGDRTTIYTVAGQSVSLNSSNNISQTVQVNGIKPPATGELIVEVRKGTTSAFADLNALVIESFVDSGVPLAPAELVVTSYTMNSLALRWKDNSNTETGFELWRAPASTPNDFSLIRTNTANANTYTDTGLQTGQMYYYKVRTIGAGGIPSPFSATLTASTLSFIISVNFNDFLNAPTPWNNLPNSLSVDSPPFSLRNNSGNLTGLSLTCTDNFNGTNTSGMNTGNNSGVYPDAVIRGFNYLETGAHAKLLISGLNHSFGYNFTFFGSRQGTSGDRTAVYTIGSKSVSLNALGNTSQTVSINEVRPQDDGTILIDLYAPTTSGYGYINAMIIQGYAVNPPETGQPAGRLASPAATNKPTVVEDESYLLKWAAYPNPFTDKINLVFPQEVTGTIQFEMYEPNGRKIAGRRIEMENSSSTEIDLSATPLNAGLHLIKIVDPKGRMSVLRVIKKN